MNKKRVFVYFIGIALFIVAVLIRQGQVRYQRNKVIVSTYSEWQKEGKPVFVEKLLPEDVKLFVKLTLSPVNNVALEGFVPKDILDKLAEGQKVYNDSAGKQALGCITKLANEISLETGMYAVQVVLQNPLEKLERMVVYINTGVLADVICVPDNIIDRIDQKTYVWKIENGRAARQDVETGPHNGYGVIIAKGLNQGDIVVCEGFTQLSENDRVDIIRYIDNSGAKQ